VFVNGSARGVERIGGSGCIGAGDDGIDQVADKREFVFGEDCG
jgi:hypothetical protein